MPLYSLLGVATGVGDAVGSAFAQPAVAPMSGSATLTALAEVLGRPDATLLGTASFTATATIGGQAVAHVSALSATTLRATCRFVADADMGGGSLLLTSAVFAAGTATGASTAEGLEGLIHQVGGTATGAGSATLGPGQITHFASATLAGQAIVAAPIVQAMIFSGRVYGQGSFTDGTTLAVTGTATGSATVTGTARHLIGLFGVSYGQGTFDVSIPEPIFGVGTLVGFADVLRVPPPVCGPICGCRSCCGRSETDCHDCEEYHRTHNHQAVPWWWQCFECWERHAFHERGFWVHDRHKHHREWTRRPNPDGLIPDFRWNHIFGKGDLEICIHDRHGNQGGPVFIGYTMFMVSSTGVKHQVGPTDRKPAQADIGKFYVTGTAGENGQPGCWAIRWRYQRTYSDPITEQLMQFRVVDAVLAGDRDDHRHGFRRHCKYGWDP